MSAISVRDPCIPSSGKGCGGEWAAGACGFLRSPLRVGRSVGGRRALCSMSRAMRPSQKVFLQEF